jgi:hypothetical protein
VELGISRPGEVLYQAFYDDDLLVVEADGFGRATTSIVGGNYPIDYSVRYRKVFDTEQDAESAAAAVDAGEAEPSVLLGVPT